MASSSLLNDVKLQAIRPAIFQSDLLMKVFKIFRALEGKNWRNDPVVLEEKDCNGRFKAVYKVYDSFNLKSQLKLEASPMKVGRS